MLVRTAIKLLVGLGLWLEPCVATGTPAAAAEDRCLTDWSVAASVVKAQGLASVEQLTERARGRIKGTIIKTQLCEAEGGGWYYRLIVREPAGHLRSLTTDAGDPFRE